MSPASQTHEPGFIERLKKARRKRVMRVGKWLTRSLSGFFAHPARRKATQGTRNVRNAG